MAAAHSAMASSKTGCSDSAEVHFMGNTPSDGLSVIGKVYQRKAIIAIGRPPGLLRRYQSCKTFRLEQRRGNRGRAGEKLGAHEFDGVTLCVYAGEIIAEEHQERHSGGLKGGEVAGSSAEAPGHGNIDSDLTPQRRRQCGEIPVAENAYAGPAAQGVKVQHRLGVCQFLVAQRLDVVPAPQQAQFLGTEGDDSQGEGQVNFGQALGDGQQDGNARGVVIGR